MCRGVRPAGQPAGADPGGRTAYLEKSAVKNGAYAPFFTALVNGIGPDPASRPAPFPPWAAWTAARPVPCPPPRRTDAHTPACGTLAFPGSPFPEISLAFPFSLPFQHTGGGPAPPARVSVSFNSPCSWGSGSRDPAPSWTRAASYSQGPSCSRGTGFSPGRGCDWFPQLSPHCLQYATPIPALYPVENIFPKKEYPRLEIHAIILVISREYPILQREWILNERVRCYEMSLLLPSGEQGGGLPSR